MGTAGTLGRRLRESNGGMQQSKTIPQRPVISHDRTIGTMVAALNLPKHHSCILQLKGDHITIQATH
jgi:hypothetical protein